MLDNLGEAVISKSHGAGITYANLLGFNILQNIEHSLVDCDSVGAETVKL